MSKPNEWLWVYFVPVKFGKPVFMVTELYLTEQEATAQHKTRLVGRVQETKRRRE